MSCKKMKLVFSYSMTTTYFIYSSIRVRVLSGSGRVWVRVKWAGTGSTVKFLRIALTRPT